jgi:hypothetical protein
MTTFSAILRPSAPNYEVWLKVFGSPRIPLRSPHSVKMDIGPEKDVSCYSLDLAAMTLKQRAHLLGYISRTFGVLVSEVEKQVSEKGFPIRETDVIVSVGAAL